MITQSCLFSQQRLPQNDTKPYDQCVHKTSKLQSGQWDQMVFVQSFIEGSKQKQSHQTCAHGHPCMHQKASANHTLQAVHWTRKATSHLNNTICQKVHLQWGCELRHLSMSVGVSDDSTRECSGPLLVLCERNHCVITSDKSFFKVVDKGFHKAIIFLTTCAMTMVMSTCRSFWKHLSNSRLATSRWEDAFGHVLTVFMNLFCCNCQHQVLLPDIIELFCGLQQGIILMTESLQEACC